MRSIRGEFYFENDEIKSDTMNDGGGNNSIYEVMRVVDGVPLFFNEHCQRFQHSCRALNESFQFDINLFLEQIKILAKKNQFSSGNIFAEQFKSGDETVKRIYFIPHYYPTSNDYLNGVRVGVLHAEREKPEAKVVQAHLRTKANELMREEGFYEVLLVNQEGIVTEGSRSNFAYLKDNEVITSLDLRVLKGITLLKLRQICWEQNIKFIQKDFTIENLNSADAAFITGTSPKILPLNQVGGMSLKVNNLLMRELMRRYDDLVRNEVEKRKA